MIMGYEDINSGYTNRVNVRKNFFTQRVVNGWNRLISHVVEAPSVNAFKNRLDNFLPDMDN